jgi:molybdopterin converting factor subunit 1
MLVRVLYFAAVRDLTALEEESLELPSSVRTVEDFARFLTERYPALAPRLSSIRFARNEVFASLKEGLCVGDTLAVIPPVAGG